MATSTQLKASHSAVMNSLLKASAASLARSCEFEAAKSLLAGLPNDPEVQDLLARVYVQSGKIDDAKACLHEALKLNPGAVPSLSALRVLDEPRYWPRLRTRSRLFFLAAMALLAVVATSASLTFISIEHRRPNPVARLKPAGPSVSEASTKTVTFGPFFFTSGIRISAQGKDKFREILNEIPTESIENVEVVGRADQVPIRKGTSFRSNRDLAIARASEIARLLERSGMNPNRISLHYELAPKNGSHLDSQWRTTLVRITVQVKGK